MTKKERERLLQEYMQTGDTYELMIREIDRAARKARRDERDRLRDWGWDAKQELWMPKRSG